ncbi:hypothetical protein K0M31_002369 [Melipona bicolor]|uniref:Uncharacterized protein n=1 Tax=Melipona bicolor TaxID=60889 RepID=A0AA40GIG4_9HYME|nr:hypothetical protein K0M31_002369 [Melipona bicolor]
MVKLWVFGSGHMGYDKSGSKLATTNTYGQAQCDLVARNLRDLTSVTLDLGNFIGNVMRDIMLVIELRIRI